MKLNISLTEDDMKVFNDIYVRYNVELSKNGERAISQSKFFLRLIKCWKQHILKEV